jgi:hypothetical protein
MGSQSARGTMDRPTLIGPDAFRRPAAETPGVDRREAFADNHVGPAGPEPKEAIVFRVGEGEILVNVDGP